MQRTSLAEAKAHLSALVDDAEHHGKRIVILRHGKPAAAIVPVDVAMAKGPTPTSSKARLSKKEIAGLFAALGKVSPEVSAVADLLAARR